jgi:outer membrane receptor protein involved in Fe transport
MIPVVALARTDVLKDGASAIYGADAMAGVVNLVTRTDYEGLGLSVRQGITERGDGSDLTADLLWGIRNDRGGFMAAVTYQKTSAVNMASRAPCSLAETTPGSLMRQQRLDDRRTRAPPNGQQINFNQVPEERELTSLQSRLAQLQLEPVSQCGQPSRARQHGLLRGLCADRRYPGVRRVPLYVPQVESDATPGTLRNLDTSQQSDQSDRPEPGPGPAPPRRTRRAPLLPGDRYLARHLRRGKLANDWAWEVAGSFGRNTAVDGSTNIANLERVANTLDRSKCSSTAGHPLR